MTTSIAAINATLSRGQALKQEVHARWKHNANQQRGQPKHPLLSSEARCDPHRDRIADVVVAIRAERENDRQSALDHTHLRTEFVEPEGIRNIGNSQTQCRDNQQTGHDVITRLQERLQ